MNATERSILEQFEFWRALPDQGVRAETGRHYAVVGCGTSFYLAQAIAAALNANGFSAVPVPGNEWTIRPESYAARKDVTVIAVSRSGESTETVAAARASRARGQQVIALSCEPESTLPREADIALVARTHPEEGIVMTSSASLMLLLGLQFAHVPLNLDAIAADASRLLDEVRAADLGFLADRRHIVFLGGGPLHGIAAEGALKLMEMSCTATQVFHPLEYRHGPISLADETVAAVMLYSSDATAEAGVAAAVSKFGARVIGFGGPGDLSFANATPEPLRGITVLPALQLLGEIVARQRGRDTLAPRNLTKVVQFG